jgi:hypothetical protein
MSTNVHDQLFPHDNDPLRKFQREQREDAEREAAEKQAARERSSESALVQSLRGEIVELKTLVGKIVEQSNKLFNEIDGNLERMGPWIERLIAAKIVGVEAKLLGEIAQVRGELRGYVSVLDPQAVRARAEERKGQPFQFATEGAADAEVVDLPNLFGTPELH